MMSEIKTLSIDIETYSDIDLSKCGIYRYTESDAFEILLFGYAVNGGEVQVIDLACGETVPAEIIAALTDETVTKWTFNHLTHPLNGYACLPGFADITHRSFTVTVLRRIPSDITLTRNRGNAP